MDKTLEVNNLLNHSIQILERKNLIISGLKKLDSFNEYEFIMLTSMGYLVIKGETLELLKLDTTHGTISIKGKLNSISYLEDNKNNKSENIISKLFK